ncbi:MAG: PASTA domain-containing protein, partial [Clostridia bacterium]|nr:PASTA domain-containing protein [Clostridia bacterium]
MKGWKLISVLIIGTVIGFLYVYLGIGVPKVPVPPLVGKEITEATKLLNGGGLNIKVVGEEESTTFPPNYIVSQKPLPGVNVRKGSFIEVVVSGKEDMVSVPDLVGRKLSEVNAFIKEVGLVIGDVITIRSLLAPSNVIIGQSVSPGIRVKRGTKVDLLVSLGYEVKEVSVPEVIGLPLDKAKSV